MRAGRLERAQELLEAAVVIDPSDAIYAYWAGHAHQRLGHMEPAAARFEQAARLDPTEAAYHECLGGALQRLGKPREAAEAYQLAIHLDATTSAYVHHALGHCLLELGEDSQALEEFEQAVALDGAVAGFHWDKGLALAKLGDLQAASGAMQRAIEVAGDGDAAASHFALGEVLQCLCDDKGSFEAYGAAAALDTEKALYYARWGEGCCMEEQFSQAVAALSRALELDDGSGSPLTSATRLQTTVFKALSHYKLGEFQAAAATVEAIEGHPDLPLHGAYGAHVLTVLGLAYCRQGALARGLPALERAAAQDGALPLHKVNLGFARLEAGDVGGARAVAHGLLSAVEWRPPYQSTQRRDQHELNYKGFEKLKLAIALRVLAKQYSREHGEKYREVQECFRYWVYGEKDPPWCLLPCKLW